MEFILQPWPWYLSGFLIAFSMFLMFYFGKQLSISSNLENLCSISGAGKWMDYFKFDLRKKRWNIAFMLGLIVGGFLTTSFLVNDQKVLISQETITDLQELGFENPGESYLPSKMFSIKSMTVKSVSILLIGGFLIGFGARYAGGCTSGHAIVGLSSFELPSLISTIGFFIGGLIMTWFIYPLIF